MGYSAIASTLRGKCTELEGTLSGAENVSIDSVWTGSASDNATTSLKEVMAKVEKEISNINSFADALDSLQNYKDTKEKIASLKSEYNSIPATDENQSRRVNLSSVINSMQVSNNQLKNKLISAFAGFSSVSSEIEVVSYDPSSEDYGQFLFSVENLVALYANNYTDSNPDDPLKILQGGSLYDYYNSYDADGNVIEGSGKAYVEGIITNIQKKYSGREAAVNSALAILQLAADKGIKLDYEHKGTNPYQPYVPTEQVASGVDCNPFVSWCVDKGVEGGFQWRPVGSFQSVGDKIERDNWTSAKPGDLLSSEGHIIMIVDNDPEKQTFTIAHASGGSRGILIEEKAYSSFGSYTVRDMTNVYNGTVDTDREAFDKYVNWSTYQRKV